MLNQLNPYALSGPNFLVFLAVVFLGLEVITFSLRLAILKKKRDPFQPQGPVELDEYETAFLAGGSSRVWLLAVARLVSSGRMKLAFDSRLKFLSPAHPHAHPIEHLLTESKPGNIRIARRLLEGPCETLRSTLASQGLLLSPDVVRSYRAMVLFIHVLLAGMTIARIMQGIHNDKPVGFLGIALLIIIVMGAGFFAAVPFRTLAGKQRLRELKQQHPMPTPTESKNPWQPTEPTTQSPLATLTDWSSPAIAPAIALWGLTALADHPDYPKLSQVMLPAVGSELASSSCSASTYHERARSGSSSSCSSTSCSSSSCSSGGGGSSCGGGGGGCGGCSGN